MNVDLSKVSLPDFPAEQDEMVAWFVSTWKDTHPDWRKEAFDTWKAHQDSEPSR
jgi:hypothetical protein